MIDKWISEGSGWIVESVDAEYVNISFYSPLSRCSYIELPDEIRNSNKSLINIENNGNKSFLWYHIGHLNPLKVHSERITKKAKRMIFVAQELNFLSLKGIIVSLNRKTAFASMYFVIKKIWFILSKFEDCMDLLLIKDENKWRYVYIKDFRRFMWNMMKSNNKKHFGENYFKQLAIPFKNYADFESFFKRIHIDDTNDNASYTKKYQTYIPCSFT